MKERIERIEKDIVQGLIEKYHIDMSTCLYDLTSTFLYSRGDDFKKRGYSRDHMSHLVQVVIGLALTREDGFPIKHWVHPGNTTDVAVLPDAAAQLKELYNEQITLVFDRGNLSEHNVKVLDGLGYHYICGLKLGVKKVKEIIRGAKDKEFKNIKTILDEYGKERSVYGISVEADLWGKKRKVVICYSEPKAETEKYGREKAIEGAKIELETLQKKIWKKNYSHDSLVIKIHKTVEGVSRYFDITIKDFPPTAELTIEKENGSVDKRKLRWVDKRIDQLKAETTLTVEEVRDKLRSILGDKRRYYRYRVKESKGHSVFTWKLKEDVVEEAGEFDGYYALMSTKTDIPMEDIVDINDSRDVVEKSFQTLKHPVKIRPIRHWVPEMVRAHVYICILGYLLRQMLHFLIKRQGLSCSVREALISLRRVKLIQIGDDKDRCLRLTNLNDDQRELFDLVGMSHDFPPC